MKKQLQPINVQMNWTLTIPLLPSRAMKYLLYGTFLVLRSPREHRAWVGPAAFGAAIVLAFLRYSWVFPSYAAVKATYLLPAMLPASYAVVVALDRFGARTRSALRGALLAIGTVVAAITWWGWWW